MRAEKQLLLDEIKEAIEGAESMVLISNKGLNVNETSDFRNDLIKSKAEVRVVPKRLFLRAAEESGVTFHIDTLVGNLGIVVTKEDPISIAKILYDFVKDKEEKIEILGGHVEGKMYSTADLKELSTLPSKDQMRAEFLGTLEAPMSQTLAAIQALLTSVIYCLENKGKSDE